MRKHTLALGDDGHIPAICTDPQPSPHATDTADCIAWLRSPIQGYTRAPAVALTVGRIIVLVARERDGHAVALYQDGVIAGRTDPGATLDAAWAHYLYECVRIAQVLIANIQTHIDATPREVTP
jgi:hypothetical protein